MKLPKIIQGGMGVAVSSWQLANTVSKYGQLGVVSGTGIAVVMVSRLQKGDEGGHIRRALSHFPIPEIATAIIDKYYVEGGIPPNTSLRRPQMWSVNPSLELNQLTVAANFAEVWLAKEGHGNPVGINLLEKVQLPNLASLYGAMLAGVDYVIMGAGIPMQVPGALDAFATHQPFRYRLDVTDAEGDVYVHLNPKEVLPGIEEKMPTLNRPFFLPIVSSVVLALALKKRANGEINGFVIELPIAGGHNAPPRGEMQLNERGEPIYGAKDEVDLKKFRRLDLPFWLAGGYGSPEKLQEALDEGAEGVQVGTAFAYCEESGMTKDIRQKVIQSVCDNDVDVVTSARVSPTGFPFKVVQVSGTLSDIEIYEARPRICDMGFLRELYKDEDGKIGYRCSAEPVDAYVKKGGDIAKTEGRGCLCNNLGAAAGFPQVQKTGHVEPPIVTSGDDLPSIVQFLRDGAKTYSAKDVIDVLLQGIEA